jgi:hypothetical protein
MAASAVPSGRIMFGLYPATMWLANFQLSLRDEGDARGGAKLFHLFDDEHFDWLAARHKFEAELVE